MVTSLGKETTDMSILRERPSRSLLAILAVLIFTTFGACAERPELAAELPADAGTAFEVDGAATELDDGEEPLERHLKSGCYYEIIGGTLYLRCARKI